MTVPPYSQSYDQIISFNRQLAEKIITDAGEDPYIKTICSGDFLIDPTAHLIHEMIKRWVGRSIAGDSARAFVISQIPHFIEKVSSQEYLKSFAFNYFKNDPKASEMMQIFEKSITQTLFQNHLKSATEAFKKCQKENKNFYFAEESLRLPLTIFRQSAQLQEYTYPEDASLESDYSLTVSQPKGSWVKLSSVLTEDDF